MVHEVLQEVAADYHKNCSYGQLETQETVDFLNEADSDLTVLEFVSTIVMM